METLSDCQLQVEHALDPVGRTRVLFVDASLDCAAPFEARVLRADPRRQVATHALSPAAVMRVFETLHGRPAPPCTLLAIRGSRFVLGEGLGSEARRHLAQALAWYPGWLSGRTAAAQQAPGAPL